jgi:glucan 1,3-beta-glucosidase
LLLPLILQIGAALAAWWARGVQPTAVSTTSYLMRWIRRNDQSHDGAARLLGVLRLAFLFGAAFACLVLFFDPRYRDFPTALYAVPAVGYALLAWIEERTSADVEEIVLAAVIVTFALLIAISEHLTTPRDTSWAWAESFNHSTLAWTATCLLLAGSVLLPVVVELRARQRQYAEQKRHG